MDRHTYTTILLQRRIRKHGLTLTQEQYDGLFRDFLELWTKAETEAVNRRESKLLLLSGLDSFLLAQIAKRNEP